MGGDGGSAETRPEGAVLSLKQKSGGKVKVSVDLKGLKSSVSGTTLELSYPADVLKLVGEGSHRAGEMVPERLKNTVYWNVLPDNDYETQDGRLVFGLSSAEQWADADGQLAQLEFEVLNAAKLGQAEMKLTQVELTPDGFETRALAGSRLSLGSGEEKALGVDYGNAESEILYKVGNDGNWDYVFNGPALDGAKDPELELVEGLTYVFELQQGGFPFYVGTEAGFGNAFSGLEVEGNGLDGTGQRVVLMPGAETPRQLSYYSNADMTGVIRVVKADAGEVDEGVSLPREGTGEGEGEPENAVPVLAGMSDVQLESGGSKSVSVSFSDSDQGDSHTVTVSSSESKVSVSGSGNTSGSEYTLSAAEGYEGTVTVTVVVSDGTDSDTGTFQVSVDSGGESFGDPVVYANNTATVMGNVSINGEPAGAGDVVAIYVGEELRAKKEVIMQGEEAWVIALVNAAGGEETITFKVYDASAGVTFEKSGSSAVITPGASAGTYEDPLLIQMNTTVTQSLSLKAGWNLVSFYVEPEDAAPATVLASIMDKLVQIKNLTNSYDPALPFFLNTLSELSVKEGYWLKVSETVSLEVEGMVPAGASMTVKKGWNLVGYPRESGEAPASELASLGSTVVQIKNLTKSYDPALPGFLNTLTTMEPGLGYWLKVTENGTWTVGDVSESGSGRDIAKASNEGGPEWGPAVVYPNVSATVFAQVTVAGKAVSKGSVVGVYVGDELRGQHEVVLANGKSYATLNVNLAGAERVSYRIWDGKSGKEYGVSQQMQLEMGETYGSAEEVVKLDGVVPRVGVRILSYTRSPFGFEFESEAGRSYVVEATGDLKEWKSVQTLEGSAKRTRFTPKPKPKSSVRYFRVRLEQ